LTLTYIILYINKNLGHDIHTNNRFNIYHAHHQL